MGSALNEGLFSLSEEEAHHVRKVLRGKSGDVLEVVDATGSLFSAELREGPQAAILEKLEGAGERRTRVALYQAIPKGKHMDFVVEKCTEVGVDVIVPLVSERSVVRPGVRPGAGDGKANRWRRVAQAAARQSLQLKIPEVAEPASFGEALRGVGDSGILLHNEEGLPPLEDTIGGAGVSLFVGPEGGWGEEEVGLARDAGFSVASLGPYRLRSETAGIVATSRARAALERPGAGRAAR